MKTYVHFWLYLAQFFLEREMFQTNVTEKSLVRSSWYTLYIVQDTNKFERFKQYFHILFTHQQMHFLLNLEKFKFTWKYT